MPFLNAILSVCIGARRLRTSSKSSFLLQAVPMVDTLETNPLPSGDVDATKMVQGKKGIESSSSQLTVKPAWGYHK